MWQRYHEDLIEDSLSSNVILSLWLSFEALQVTAWFLVTSQTLDDSALAVLLN